MRPPRLEDIIAESLEAKLEDVHTAEPGWVMDYDPASKTATVQPALAQSYIGENGERKLSTKPPSRATPVAFPGGIVWRLEPGDPVLLVYCSTSLDNWSAGRNRVADPGDDRRHNLSDGFVIPLGTAKTVAQKGEITVEYDKVNLGKVGVGSRSPVVRRTDLQAGRALAQGLHAAAVIAADAPLVASLAALLEVFDAMLDIMSDNVRAT